MSDPKRLVILKALTDLLKTVTPTNGYQHDLSNSVYRGRSEIGDNEPLPMVNILESLNPDREPVSAGDFNVRRQKDRWVLLLVGWAKDDKANPTDPAHPLMADVKKCLAQIIQDDSAHFCLGGLVEGAVIEPGTVRPPDENSSRAYFWLRVVLDVTEKLVDPFDSN